MPRKETNYNNTVIYKIQHVDKEDLIYVGSTTDFTNRKYHHKSSCNLSIDKSYNLKVYKMIRENGGWDMFKMIEVKKVPCADKREAVAEEDTIMKNLKANMNSRGSVLNVEHEHFWNNSKVLCDCGVFYTRKHKTRHMASEKHMQTSASDLVQCDCGQFLRRSNQQSQYHAQTQRHKNGMVKFAPRICKQVNIDSQTH